MTLSENTRVHELLRSYPFLEDHLLELSPKFAMLRSRVARATIGRLATLRSAAEMAGMDPATLVRSIADEIERRTGVRPEVVIAAPGAALTREQRITILRGIISDLHAGGDLEEARRRFAEAVADVEASEIAEMEEQLIQSGLPVSEVQRLCDVHVGAFRPALDRHAEIEVPAGHPVHTYRADNQEISRLADALGRLAQKADQARDDEGFLAQASALLDRLTGVENHYQRKENQLFPLLERHDLSAPSKVMWGVHDEIRTQLKRLRREVAQSNALEFGHQAVALSRALVEMIYKEEKILFPMAMQTLSENEWAEVRRGEDEIGYVLAQPAAAWPAAGTSQRRPTTGDGDMQTGRLSLSTGELSLEQVNLLLTHLPVDVTYVDESDTVRFYSEGPERIFRRTPAVIGRKVQNCHPPKSVSVVEEILAAFREGRRSVAEFWIPLEGKFIHIRYFAIRDAAGTYRGCLEVTQDVTAIRQLEGQRRLLDWRA